MATEPISDDAVLGVVLGVAVGAGVDLVSDGNAGGVTFIVTGTDGSF